MSCPGDEMKIANNYSLPEILAPGGDPDSIRAAILAGADAVYVGLSRFNARMRAVNLSLKELAALTELAHNRGVRIYVTLNVLLSQEEIQEALTLAVDALHAGADALILQDWGLLGLVSRLYPQVEIHASTQLTTHNSRQIDVLSALGVRQLNLCRELSLDEIGLLTRHCRRLNRKAEVFVHGAYCISFSGQCYLSSLLCGLSGNRGMCVQPCRRRYHVYTTESGRYSVRLGGTKSTPPQDAIPFLSLKDNNAITEAHKLVEVGVDAFKIEGRRKGFYYVYTIVRAWRAKLASLLALTEKGQNQDTAVGGTKATNAAMGRKRAQAAEEAVDQVYNRGFDIGYLTGRISSEMFSNSDEDHSLTPLGTVASYSADNRILKTVNVLSDDKLGQGMAINIFADDSQEQFIAQMAVEERLSATTFKVRIEHELKGHILHGHHICRLPNYKESESLALKIKAMKVCRIPLRIQVAGSNGTPLTARFYAVIHPGSPVPSLAQDVNSLQKSDPSTCDFSVWVLSTKPLTSASKNPLSVTTLYDHFGKLGGTRYELDPTVTNHGIGAVEASALDEDLFLPVSELNRMRREAISRLDSLLGRSSIPLPIKDPFNLKSFVQEEVHRASHSHYRTGSVQHAVSRLSAPPLPAKPFDQRILPALADPDDVALLRDIGLEYFLFEVRPGIPLPDEPGLIPWFPAIILDEDFPLYDEVLHSRRWPLILSDNSGLGRKAAEGGLPWMAGPLLNITNAWAAATLWSVVGAGGAVFSIELSRSQLTAAIQALRSVIMAGNVSAIKADSDSPGGFRFRTAAVAFGPLLAMNTRQCLVRRFIPCRKTFCDRACIAECSASGILDGGPERIFHVMKRQGTFHQLWDARPLFIPEMPGLLDQGIDLLIIDLRNPGLLEMDRPFKKRILQSFLEGRAEGLSAIFRRRGITVTSGQFRQGLA